MEPLLFQANIPNSSSYNSSLLVKTLTYMEMFSSAWAMSAELLFPPKMRKNKPSWKWTWEWEVLTAACFLLSVCLAYLNQGIAHLGPGGFGDFVPDLELKGLDIVFPEKEKTWKRIGDKWRSKLTWRKWELWVYVIVTLLKCSNIYWLKFKYLLMKFLVHFCWTLESRYQNLKFSYLCNFVKLNSLALQK